MKGQCAPQRPQYTEKTPNWGQTPFQDCEMGSDPTSAESADLHDRPEPRESLRRILEGLLLLTERETDKRALVRFLRVEARSRDGRHTDLVRHPLGERHVVQIAER